MSRYILQSPNYPNHEIVVGWDAPLRTYFCIIQDLSIEEDEEEIDPTILWVGTNYDEIMTVEELRHQIAAYVTIPSEIVVQLRQDALEPFEPSPVQALFRNVFDSNRN